MNTMCKRLVVAAALGATAVTGCTSEAVVDRSGGDTLVLRLGTSDGLVKATSRSFGQDTFVKELQKVSGGRIEVDVVTDVGEGGPGAESAVVEAVASGDLDLGYAGTRAFAEAGVEGLGALEAPFLLTNVPAVEELVDGPGGDLVLDAVDGSGAVALGTAIDGLRRPFAVERPLVEPEAWRDVAFRVYNSPVQRATAEALGATAVPMTHGWIEAVSAGELDALELGVDVYDELGLGTEAPHLATNVVLWPKLLVFLMNEDRFASLTDEQRGWVEEAARRAHDTSFAASWDETEHLRRLCARGVVPAVADDAQLRALRDAVEPVYRSLREDPVEAVLMREVESVAAQFPEVDTPELPQGCGTDRPDPAATGPSDLADGVYRAAIPVSAVEAAGLSNGPGWSGVWTLTVDDATFALTCRPLDEPGRDCGQSVTDDILEAGRLEDAGDRVHFVSDQQVWAELTGCSVSTCPLYEDYSAAWRAEGDRLRFSDPEGAASSYLAIVPWVRVR